MPFCKKKVKSEVIHHLNNRAESKVFEDKLSFCLFGVDSSKKEAKKELVLGIPVLMQKHEKLYK